MLFAFGPEDLQRLAIPIGIGIAVLLFLLVPPLRRTIINSFNQGKDAGEKFTGKKKDQEEKDEGTGGK